MYHDYLTRHILTLFLNNFENTQKAFSKWLKVFPND